MVGREQRMRERERKRERKSEKEMKKMAERTEREQRERDTESRGGARAEEEREQRRSERPSSSRREVGRLFRKRRVLDLQSGENERRGPGLGLAVLPSTQHASSDSTHTHTLLGA